MAAGTGSGSTLSYTTGALTSGLWYFRVTAYNANADSTPSNTVSITI